MVPERVMTLRRDSPCSDVSGSKLIHGRNDQPRRVGRLDCVLDGADLVDLSTTLSIEYNVPLVGLIRFSGQVDERRLRLVSCSSYHD